MRTSPNVLYNGDVSARGWRVKDLYPASVWISHPDGRLGGRQVAYTDAADYGFNTTERT